MLDSPQREPAGDSGSAHTGGTAMATAREMMERAISTWNARDKSAWISLFGPDFDLSLPGGLQADGIAAAQLFYALWQDAFPDNRVEPQRIISEGDTVVLESIFDGTRSEERRVGKACRSRTAQE